MGFAAPERLTAAHEIEKFDCGEPALNRWFDQFAIAANADGTARVFVVPDGDQGVAGFYALTAAQIESDRAPARVRKGQPTFRPIPVILISRLAVDRRSQRTGLGSALIRDALLRCVRAAELIGIRAVTVHAKDADARQWYRRFGFEPSPTDSLHLILLLKDVRAVLNLK